MDDIFNDALFRRNNTLSEAPNESADKSADKSAINAIVETPKAQDLGEIISFLNTHLRPGCAWSIAEEYPTSLTTENIHNMRLIRKNGGIASFAVFRPMIMRTPIGAIRVAGIGSVVTDPQKRRQGLSQAVIRSCLDGANAASCDFAILWTDLFNFYRKMGFELAGSEISFLLKKTTFQQATSSEPPSTLSFLETTQISPEAILRLFNTHSVTTHRAQDAVKSYLRIPNSRVATAWNNSGQLAAYAVIGKGADLNGYIHEWGGSTSSLIRLFSHILDSASSDLRLITPAHSANLIAKMRALGCEEHRGYLGMIKILNTESLLGKIKRHALSLGIQNFNVKQIDHNTHQFEIQNPGLKISFQTNSEQDLVQLLFGPESPSTLLGQKQLPDQNLEKFLDRVFPIPMWVWGWDSI